MELQANYLNLGTMGFDTLNLPASSEEIEEFFNKLNPHDNDVELQWVEIEDVDRIAKGYNELSLAQLTELAEVIEDEDGFKEFDVIYSVVDSFDEALKIWVNGDYQVFYDCKNDSDLGWELAHELVESMENQQGQSILTQYFDYEAYGRDARLSGGIYNVDYDTMIQLFY